MAEIGGPETAGDDTSPVFISYASQDTAVAAELVSALERHGVPCWIAPRDVRAGAQYADAIVRAINGAKAVLVVLSQNAIVSSHVGKEIERSSSKKRPIIALRIDNAALTPALEYFLSESQWVEAQSERTAATYTKLIEAIHDLNRTAPDVAGSPAQDASPGKTPVAFAKSRRARILFAAGGAVVAAIFATLLVHKYWPARHNAGEHAVTAGTPASSSAAPAILEKSVAVLPFVDMSEKKDQEYFSDGMTEEIINLLVKIPELRVPARTSSFYFKGRPEDIPTIANKLKVAHVLEGSVRRSGNHLRITAQLVRADNGYHIWSQTFDRQFTDVFKVQDEIAAAVVKVLKVSILDKPTVRGVPTPSGKAYTLYLQAQLLARQGSDADKRKAYAYLRQALAEDPNFALAWAALAALCTDDSVDWLAVFEPALAGSYGAADYAAVQRVNQRVAAEAHAAAAKAIELGPMLGEAHLATGLVRWWIDWDWAEADAEFAKAREIDPGSASIAQAAAGLANTLGRFDAALALANRATTQDPLGTAYWEIGAASYRLGALSQAGAAYQTLTDLYPTGTANHYRYGLVLLAQREPQAALREMDRDEVNYRQLGLPLALDALGRHAEADRELAVGVQRWSAGMAYQIALVYAARKDFSRAFDWLERAYRQHDSGLLSLKGEPLFLNVATDPRYKEFLHKMKFPE